jgi:hypothetical protein
MSVRDRVEFIGDPSPIQEEKPFTLEVEFDSEAAGKVRFSVDEGRTIFPSSIDVGGGLVSARLKDLFVISGGGSKSANIRCSLRGTHRTLMVTLT